MRLTKKTIELRRVVVTGVGTVSPLGLTTAESWKNALSGVSGIARITRFNAEAFDAQIAGEVKGFNPDAFIHKKEQKKMDLFIQFAMAAAEEAIKDSGIEITEENKDRIGSFVGAGMGGLPVIEEQHEIFRTRGPGRISPFYIPSVISNLASGQIAMKHGLRGSNFCITSACATGAHAIGEATHAIRRGDAEIMVAGGTESVVCPTAIGGFGAMKALSTRNDSPQAASRPFDKARDGFVLGEGAGIMILESLESALKRGAKIYGEITGYGSTCDAYHMTSPAPEHIGAQKAMRMALKDAELEPNQIQYINAHGTSTPVGDELESQAVKILMGDHAKKIVVSSTKSMTGHLLGAAGAVEGIFCLLALRDQIAPPTINLENPSEGCDLDYAPWKAKEMKITNVLNNSFGFGGTNASVVFSKLS